MSNDENEAFYVDDLLAAPAADDDIWKLPATNNFVVVSKDSDFAVRAARDGGVRVVWIRCGNLKLTLFQAWLAMRRESMRRLLDMGEQVIELR